MIYLRVRKQLSDSMIPKWGSTLRRFGYQYREGVIQWSSMVPFVKTKAGKSTALCHDPFVHWFIGGFHSHGWYPNSWMLMESPTNRWMMTGCSLIWLGRAANRLTDIDRWSNPRCFFRICKQLPPRGFSRVVDWWHNVDPCMINYRVIVMLKCTCRCISLCISFVRQIQSKYFRWLSWDWNSDQSSACELCSSIFLCFPGRKIRPRRAVSWDWLGSAGGCAHSSFSWMTSMFWRWCWGTAYRWFLEFLEWELQAFGHGEWGPLSPVSLATRDRSHGQRFFSLDLSVPGGELWILTDPPSLLWHDAQVQGQGFSPSQKTWYFLSLGYVKAKHFDSQRFL